MTPDQAMAQIVEITANLDTYIERRARELADPRIAQVIGDAEHRVADVMAQAEADKQRSDDLVKELRRCLAASDRHIERLKEARRLKGANGG